MFKPGLLDDPDELSVMKDFDSILSVLKSNGYESRVHRDGVVIIPGGSEIYMSKVLFDSGALHKSYISKQLYEKHKEVLAPHVRLINANVRMGDNQTCVQVNQAIEVGVSFVNDDLKEYAAVLDFHVWEMPGLDMIVGLPDIVEHFAALFYDMLLRDKLGDLAEPEEPKVYQLDEITAGTFIKYSSGVDDDAPEAEYIPEPCAFTGPLYFMEMSHEDAVKEYMEQLKTHVDPGMAASTDIIKLLSRSDIINVFCPIEWNGILGFPPLELEWLDTLPKSLKPRARSINPKLFENAHTEFKRLMQYMYEPSKSPIASCLVIAPKATKPFIRFAGDYITVNKYVVRPQSPIPNVQHELNKALKFSFFVDLDLTNSFHQIVLGPITAANLAVQTPWGLVQPKNLPEGVSPASGMLQDVVRELFSDYEEWTIVIFDNILLLAESYQDAYNKFEIVAKRCVERHVVLKMGKSWFGFDKVTFFGYIISKGRYWLSDDRKKTIMDCPFPRSQKAMRGSSGLLCSLRVLSHTTRM